jgi:thymidylate synthase (FAD)
MTDLTFLSDVSVALVRHDATDLGVCKAARVSTLGEQIEEELLRAGFDIEEVGQEEFTPKDRGLINYLMRDRHGSPFEHNSMTFFVKAPMVVFWQTVRHRVGWSYNIESGRYRELGPTFYVPSPTRPLVQTGKAGAYDFETDDGTLHAVVVEQLERAYETSWDAYQTMIQAGVAREVARLALGFGIYFSGYVTCNARSLMHFLSLRTKYADATVTSSPQQEINMVADKMENLWRELMPSTHASFVANGRVAP